MGEILPTVDLEALYQDVILDHSRKPRNFGELADADVQVHADNPMCGDDITVFMKLDDDGTVERVKFTGNGCSICMASASLMTNKLKKKSPDDCTELSGVFKNMLTAEEEPELDKRLGDLQLLKGVRMFPQRTKCATLAWHAFDQALAAALKGEKGTDISLDDD